MEGGFDGDDSGPQGMARARPAASAKGSQLSGANANDADAGDTEGVTSAEYNKWLMLEQNWESAEETRHSYMEGSQFRKSRDERHRERGMERQATSIEQMKQAKAKVEEHRESNLEQGKSVREDVQGWKESLQVQAQSWLEHGKSLREKTVTVERQRAERDALLAMKKKLSAQVKMEVLQLTQDGKVQKDQVLASNREQAGKVRAETAAEVTDAAKKSFFEQRKAAAMDTQKNVKAWEAERKAIRQKFRDESARSKDKSRKIEAQARLSRKQLQEQRAMEAEEIREHKKQVQAARRAQEEEHAALVKQVVNATAAEKFATPLNSKRMLQHPHYQEVTAVVTDVTSQISKEIAASPRRRPPSAGKAVAAVTHKAQAGAPGRPQGMARP